MSPEPQATLNILKALAETMPETPDGLGSLAPAAGSALPWMMKPLDEWAIVGMNHYHIGGQKRLFVALVKDGRCIKEEGPDDKYLWNRLWHKATQPNSLGEPTPDKTQLKHGGR